jgi:uncharacterized membrane protein YdjX (TVP38/TMEM64 family)
MTQDHPPRLSRWVRLLGDPRVRIIIALGTLAGLGILVWAWNEGVTPTDVKRWLEQMLKFLREHPAILFFAACILPALPLPASPFIILMGVVYTPLVGTPGAVALAILAMGINMSWTWWIASGPARNWVERLIERYEFTIPKLGTGGAVQLICILRLTPGFPFFVQNLILGFLRVPFRLYLLLSLGLTSVFTAGFVISGGAILAGKGALALGGLVLIMLAVVLTNLLRKKLSKKAGQAPLPPAP